MKFKKNNPKTFILLSEAPVHMCAEQIMRRKICGGILTPASGSTATVLNTKVLYSSTSQCVFFIVTKKGGASVLWWAWQHEYCMIYYSLVP